MYRNILVEIIKNKLSFKKIAKELNTSEEMLVLKIHGKEEFSSQEVLKLISICGNLPCKYLFHKTSNLKKVQ